MNRIIAVVACLVSMQAQAGEIRGSVKILTGLTRKRVAVPAYQTRGVGIAAPPAEAGPIDELDRVVIYLEGGSLERGDPVTVEMKQRERRFVPDIVVIAAGSSISFPNGDPIFHNVFSLSGAKQFDLGYYPEGQTRTIRFDKPGVVLVYCRLHPNMGGAVLVVPTDFYTRPLPDGTFQFPDVPAGSYRVVAWHKSAGALPKRVALKENETVEVDFSLPGVR